MLRKKSSWKSQKIVFICITKVDVKKYRNFKKLVYERESIFLNNTLRIKTEESLFCLFVTTHIVINCTEIMTSWRYVAFLSQNLERHHLGQWNVTTSFKYSLVQFFAAKIEFE